MSLNDKGGDTPESPETPEPTGEPTPDEATTPVESDSEAAEAETPAETAAETPAEAAADDGAFPAPEEFASAKAASGRGKLLPAIIAVLSVLLIAAVVALLVVLLKKDAKQDNEAEIKQTIQSFVDVVNGGKAGKAELSGLVCEEQLAQTGEGQDGPPPVPQIRIDAFDVKVYGVTATAIFTISGVDAPDMPPEQIPMRLVNEDGWKVCNFQ